MSIVTGLLTVVLVLDCMLLGLLILIQLPKKDAGMGQAFGGGATDALFGAGSGNVLTKLTKYGAGIFFVLSLTLSILGSHQARKGGTEFEQKAKSSLVPSAMPLGGGPAAPTHLVSSNLPVASTTTAPAFKPPTNVPAPASPRTAPPQPK